MHDYLDTVVLFERPKDRDAAEALRSFDEIYRQPGTNSPLAEVGERLAAAEPRDAAAIDLQHYRGLQAPWNEWRYVVERGRHWAQVVSRVSLEDPA